MTEPLTRCRYCPRTLTTEESIRRGYGEKCGRDRGLIPPKRRPAARPRVRRLKPAPVTPDPDALPGQTEMALFFHQPALDSL